MTTAADYQQANGSTKPISKAGKSIEEDTTMDTGNGNGYYRGNTTSMSVPASPTANEDWSSDFSDDSDDRRRKRAAKWEKSTPNGARRSKRFRGDEDGEDVSSPLAANGVAAKQQQQQANNTTNDGFYEVPVGAFGDVIGSPTGPLRRNAPEHRITEELAIIQGMWEMASILDFLHLFRKQLNLQRKFSGADLERVLITSPGDAGLLADVHIDIMRGISPKSEITTANWQIHLANKIKFHWKALYDGSHCPFKPDKYYEAVTYAALPTVDRVRALHFICCVRTDREDIQTRISEAEKPKSKTELLEFEAAAEQARQRAARITRNVATEDVELPEIDTMETFRREPTGVDSKGLAYYYFDLFETTGFRLYRETPAPVDLSLSDDDDDDDDGYIDGKEPVIGTWELIASTLDELVSVGEDLVSPTKGADDKALGRLILDDIVPGIKDREEAEERKKKAEERVRARLAVSMVEPTGRPRREGRRPVNYTFDDYDDMLRSAIRRTQRGDVDSSEDGRRGRRATTPQRIDDVDAALNGMRRGRSVANVLGASEPPIGDLDERALRKAARAPPPSRLGNGGGGGNTTNDDEEEEEDERRARFMAEQAALDQQAMQQLKDHHYDGNASGDGLWGKVPVGARTQQRTTANLNAGGALLTE